MTIVGGLSDFPYRLAVQLFFLGPLAGTLVMVVIGEWVRPHPMWDAIAGALIFAYIVFGLPIFGLWVTVLGVLTWWVVHGWQFLERTSFLSRITLGALGGGIGGLVIIFFLWYLFSLDPDWPQPDKFVNALADRIKVFSIAGQGLIGGIVCGIIIVLHVNSPLQMSSLQRN